MWDMEREFRLRAWHQKRSLDSLGGELNSLSDNYQSIQAAISSIPGTVTGFDVRIAELEPRLKLQRQQLQSSMDQYSDYLEQLAVAELEIKRERIQSYRAQARFALASIYDRMSARNE